MRVFIGGIHGVGKSYLCNKFCLSNNWLHRSSSELIREFKQQSWNENKQVFDISDNQEILINALKNIKENLLLDGHFVLINQDDQLIEIDDEVFKKMGIDAIVLVENTIEIIEERFKNRSGIKININLDEFLKRERSHAQYVAGKHKIPLITLQAPSEDYFDRVIKSI
ncbi:ATP-binding protein [Serratia entomophila]|uniref:ATP-binding protein n=1 Tax=Serratia entomophila TaxID=42906 RepID=UPI002179D36F|nr:ATP-binding protein [Serratia entomophila]CAI1629980.1 Uncharacterised protein [Serratia entomophila]